MITYKDGILAMKDENIDYRSISQSDSESFIFLRIMSNILSEFQFFCMTNFELGSGIYKKRDFFFCNFAYCYSPHILKKNGSFLVYYL
jgi:hypothetical protein